MAKKLKTVETELKTSLGVVEAQSFDSGIGEGGSEVVDFYDGRLYVTNGEQNRIDIFDAASGELLSSIDLSGITGFGGLQSVTVSANGIAAAVHRDNVDFDTGVVAIFVLDGTPVAEVEVGNLPDMVTYSADGTKIYVANEGEPDDVDYAGSISIIDTATNSVQTFDFSEFDAVVDDLIAAGVRIFPDTLPSTDFEPEYISEGPDGKLYVTLQEANAVAVFDLDTMAWDTILPLGVVDHSVEGFGIDASDRDDAINITTHDVFGMRMPDAIATVEIDGNTYFLTANEGDTRDEDARVKDLELDETAFPNAAELQEDETLGRLTVSTIDGDTDSDGAYEELYAYGSRSFTIFDAAGNVVFESGDDFETIIAQTREANAFNNDGYPSGPSDVLDENRSDNKGPEPEAISVGEVDGKILAFIGLERDSGIMIYDITDPANSEFVTYIDSGALGHISPEVITFISAEDSASGVAQIAVSYEVSGTTALFDLAFAEKVVGTTGMDHLTGTIGDDLMKGGKGSDFLMGLAGEDVIKGNKGRDQITGGEGDDVLTGGKGRDVFIFNIGDGNDTITDLEYDDLIVMTDTGLSFEDLTITKTGKREFLVEFGDQGDSIEVHTTGQGHKALEEDAFLF